MKVFDIKYLVILSSALFMFSCAKLDEEVESGIENEKPIGVIVDETLCNYDVLKSYSGDLVVGSNVSLDDLSGSNANATLLKTNFEQIMPISVLNSDVIMSDEGVLDFTDIDSYISRAEELGLSVYGDAIVSNFNQNDTYLNTIAASLIYQTPLFPNFVKSGVLTDGTFDGWTINGDVSVVDYMEQPSVKMVNDGSVSSSDATSLQSPIYTVEDGAKFELTFYVLSTQEGEGRVTFTGLNTNDPEMDWMGTGTPSATFTTKIGWNKIQIQTLDFDGSGEFSFKIELGYTSNVTYYINIQGISVINLNGSVDNPEEIFFEAEDGVVGSEWQINSDTEASNGEFVLANSAENYLSPNDAGSEPYYIDYTFNAITAGTYNCWVREWGPSGSDDSFFISVNGSPFAFNWWSLYSTNWQWVNLGTYELSVGENKFAACIRENGFKMDRFYFTMTTNIPSGVGSAAIAQKDVTLDVSDDVKKTAVEKVLNGYVEDVLTNEGEKINAWTVVSNPFAEDGSVAVSSGSSVEGTFYWADYIGGDYIAQAFSTARANAASGSKLFISENGLNTNSDKLNTIVNTVNSNNDIDGVAVSLDLNLESDLDVVSDMFDVLASTGKLIFIKDFRVSSEETEEAYALQSEIYKTVVDLYKTKIPVSQQYGISLANPVSNSFGLWDSGYNRKQGYAGFVVGLGAQE